jgi:hypothetical protein
VSLNSPLQTSGSTAPDSRPDPEFLLLEAVRQRHGQECLDRLQRCVHRRGLDWLHQFQMVTLPALEDREAAAWFGALLGCPSVESAGDAERRWIEQRAAAAVDGAIASMLVEFPQLLAPGPSLGFGLPLALAPPGLSPLETGDQAQDSLAASLSGSDGTELCSEVPDFETSSSAEFMDGELDDPAPFDQASLGSVAPGQRSAVEIAADLGSGVLRRLSRTDWRTLASTRPDPEAAPQATEPAPVPEEVQGPVASLFPDSAAAALPLPVVVQLAERQSGLGTLEDAAPAPPALADLRAWLPDSSLPRAS